MAYDEHLAERVRAALGPLPDLTEVRMFGGIGFLIRGNMAVGVNGDDLLVRLDPSESEHLLAKGGHVRPMEMGGRRSTHGWLFVDPDGTRTAKMLEAWVVRGVGFASALPPKPPKTRKQRAS